MCVGGLCGDGDEEFHKVFKHKFPLVLTAELILNAVGECINHIRLLDVNSQVLKIVGLPYVMSHGHRVAFEFDGLAVADDVSRLTRNGVMHHHFVKIITTNCHIHTVVDDFAFLRRDEGGFHKFFHTVEHSAGFFGVRLRHHKLFEPRQSEHREERARNAVPRAVGGNHHGVFAATSTTVKIAAHDVPWAEEYKTIGKNRPYLLNF